MKTKYHLKPSVLGVAVAAALAIAGGPAHALEAKLSGQVNRALMLVDDDRNAETYHVDNDSSGSRFRFTGSEDISPGLKAGITWEVEYQSNASNVVSQTTRSDTPALNERWLEAYFQGPWGRVSLGQGNGAANGGVEVDLSGTSVINGSIGAALMGAAFQFRNSAAPGDLSGVTIGDVISNQDFESRYDRLHYGTPKLGPVVIAVSTGTKGNNDVNEISAKLNLNLGGGGKLAAMVGQSVEKVIDSPNENETVGGSVSWLAPGGLNLTFGTTNLEVDPGVGPTTDSDFTYFKVGLKMGQHAVAVDFAEGEDQDSQNLNEEADMTGIGYVYSPKKWAELYAAYKVLSLDRDGASFDDITVITAGTRLKF